MGVEESTELAQISILRAILTNNSSYRDLDLYYFKNYRVFEQFLKSKFRVFIEQILYREDLNCFLLYIES